MFLGQLERVSNTMTRADTEIQLSTASILDQAEHRITEMTPLNEKTVTHLPGVSILRPLKGIDFELRENLRAAFRQSYPNLEILHCVASPTDPSIQVAQSVMSEFPNIPSKLLIGEFNLGVNPKINNLHQAMTDLKQGATHDFVWILDSNCRPVPNALHRTMYIHTSTTSNPDRYVSVTHNAPFPLYPASFGARLEQLFLGTVHTRMYTVINWTGLASCLNGKSNLYRRSDLARATQGGSLDTFGEYLAEDNLVGEAMLYHIGPHRLSPDPAWQPLGEMSLHAYFSRRVRWTRIRKHNVTMATLLEPFIECFAVGAYGMLALNQCFPVLSAFTIPFYMIHVFLWYICDVIVFQSIITLGESTQAIDPRCSRKDVIGTWWQWTAAWIVRELTALPVWLWAVSGMEVNWRGQWFQLHLDGRATALQPRVKDDRK